MMRESLLYVGGALTILWGAAHLYPTRKVVQGFGRITRDNQLILTMEWIAEAILLVFAGVLVVLMTARFGAGDRATQTTSVAAAAMLAILAAVSAATGGRVGFIMYRRWPSTLTGYGLAGGENVACIRLTCFRNPTLRRFEASLPNGAKTSEVTRDVSAANYRSSQRVGRSDR
jgi:hypothetical protein